MRRSVRLLCLALTLSVAACQPSTPPTPPTPAGSAGPEGASVAPATPFAELSWREIDRPDPDPGWGAQGLLVDADGILFYGGILDQAMSWSSVDGRTWVSAPIPGVAETPSNGAASADATVLLTVTGTSQCAHPIGEMLWRRVKGQAEWAVVPFDEDLFCAGGIPQIAASPDTFVVAGTGTGEQPFAWRSADGLHWFDASNGLSFDAPPALLTWTPEGFLEIGRGSITDVRLLGPGGWTAIPVPPVPPAFNGDAGGLEPAVALSIQDGVFAFFQHEDPLRWSGWLRSPDGSWAEVGTAGIPPGFIQGGTAIRGLPYLFVFDGQRAHLIVSADLQTWAEVTTPVVSQIGGLVAIGDQVLLWGDKDPAGMGTGNPGLFVADLPAP